VGRHLAGENALFSFSHFAVGLTRSDSTQEFATSVSEAVTKGNIILCFKPLFYLEGQFG